MHASQEMFYIPSAWYSLQPRVADMAHDAVKVLMKTGEIVH